MSDCILELPTKPSELLGLALEDMAKAEADPTVITHMGVWLEVDGDGYCSACVSGAVMRYTLCVAGIEGLRVIDRFPGIIKCLRYDSIDPECAEFEEELNANIQQLMAIDSFRQGHVSTGLALLGVERPAVDFPYIWPVCDYAEDAAKWRGDMERLQHRLAEAGV